MTCVTLELNHRRKRKSNMNSRKKVLWKIFISTLYLSAFTFGGGYVIVSFMKKKFVDELHWIEEKEMLDLVAIVFTGSDPIKGTVRKRVCGDVKVLHTFFLCVEHI